MLPVLRLLTIKEVVILDNSTVKITAIITNHRNEVLFLIFYTFEKLCQTGLTKQTKKLYNDLKMF
jgi:hypothetical protein